MQPGQFLTSFLDALPAALQNYSAADKKRAAGVAKLARSNGVLFAVEGFSKRVVDIDKVFKGVPLTPPYPLVILEYTLPPVESKHAFVAQEPRPRVLIVKQVPEGVVLIPIEYYAELDVGWIPPYAMFLLDESKEYLVSVAPLLDDSFEGARKITAADGRDVNDIISRVMVADLATYAEFCRTLHEYEVTFDDIEPDATKNRMRRARGKAPLFTYKVLTIGKKKRRSAHQGGTHASPRSHLRRGYYRTSKHGVRHWVQPCMVKGETPGFVHKDYKVEELIDA
jgi:hypothetical protein